MPVKIIPKVLFAALVCVGWPAFSQSPDVSSFNPAIEKVRAQLSQAQNEIDVVEKQYTLREELSLESQQLQRLANGEIQYLLGDYKTASVLFYDLVASKDFQSHIRFRDALFFLADSLYKQKNYLGARLYLRELLQTRGTHYQEALTRYLEIAGRINEYAGLDAYLAQARELSSGQLPPELNYVYAKWLFRRPDMSVADRVPKAQDIFHALASDDASPFSMAAGYFLGVGHVLLKNWTSAVDQFKRLTERKTQTPAEKEIQELANLSLGRVYFEIAQYDDAVSSYSRVAENSANFPDSLYEIAWSYVRKGSLKRATDATDVLQLVAEDSILAPEAKILQGTLQQKLQQYDAALETYNDVINTYAPVRDEIDALLSVHKDPIQYFNELLARNDKRLDVTKLLPPTALKWASTRKDVANAMQITGALDASRDGIVESRKIADRILQTLDERGLESFPILQDGFTRADAVETTLTSIEEALVGIEGRLADSSLSAPERAQIAQWVSQAVTLKKRIETLPKTSEQLRARRERIQSAIDRIDRTAFQLSLEVQSQSAQLVAMRKYLDDTRKERTVDAAEERAFLQRLSLEQEGLEAEQSAISDLRAQLMGERSNADKAISGEVILRNEYAQMLEQQRSVYAGVRSRLSGAAQRLVEQLEAIRSDKVQVADRVATAKGVIRDRVSERGRQLREQVELEQKLLGEYAEGAEAATLETRNLVGQIAYESFKRVQKGFYDLVLKADVGVVDVSFQRKQDKTLEIQKLATQKENELRTLDGEFKEVLKDVE